MSTLTNLFQQASTTLLIASFLDEHFTISNIFFQQLHMSINQSSKHHFHYKAHHQVRTEFISTDSVSVAQRCKMTSEFQNGLYI